MRKFSKFEQKIIKNIIEVEGDEGSLVNLANVIETLYSDGIPSYYFIKVKSRNDVILKIKETEIERDEIIKMQDAEGNVSKVVIPTVLLFECLEANGLAYFTGDLNVSSIGEEFSDETYIGYDFLDDEIKELIYKYANKRIYLTESLRMFVSNGFKTEDDIRYEKELSAIKLQLKYTRCALFLTILGLLASIFVPMLTTSDVRIVNETIVLDGSVNEPSSTSITSNKSVGVSDEPVNECIQDISTMSNGDKDPDNEEQIPSESQNEDNGDVD